MSSDRISLTYDQIAFIMKHTGIGDKQKAIEYFAEIMLQERISPSKMPFYVDKMMDKEKKKK